MLNEVCEMRSCNGCVFFEMRKHNDAYMWISRTPNGPSAKFLMENSALSRAKRAVGQPQFGVLMFRTIVHTMDELRLSGNSMKGSRPILSFDVAFDSAPHWQLLRELFLQTFGTPLGHPHSKPFIDRVTTFSLLDNRVWFRNYQIVREPDAHGKTTTSMSEIGPRFTLQLIRIFDGSFGGMTLYEAPDYISPNSIRSQLRRAAAVKYRFRQEDRAARAVRNADLVVPEDEANQVFG